MHWLKKVALSVHVHHIPPVLAIHKISAIWQTCAWKCFWFGLWLMPIWCTHRQCWPHHLFSCLYGSLTAEICAHNGQQAFDFQRNCLHFQQLQKEHFIRGRMCTQSLEPMQRFLGRGCLCRAYSRHRPHAGDPWGLEEVGSKSLVCSVCAANYIPNLVYVHIIMEILSSLASFLAT